jgi:hypothetical protein
MPYKGFTAKVNAVSPSASTYPEQDRVSNRHVVQTPQATCTSLVFVNQHDYRENWNAARRPHEGKINVHRHIKGEPPVSDQSSRSPVPTQTGSTRCTNMLLYFRQHRVIS